MEEEEEDDQLTSLWWPSVQAADLPLPPRWLTTAAKGHTERHVDICTAALSSHTEAQVSISTAALTYINIDNQADISGDVYIKVHETRSHINR